MRDARQRALLRKRYPGRGPGDELDSRGYGALQADHGRLFPAGVEYPADQLRRLRAERLARGHDLGCPAILDYDGEPGGPCLCGYDAPGRPPAPGPGPEGR